MTNLDEDSQRRLETNPLRVLDTKDAEHPGRPGRRAVAGRLPGRASPAWHISRGLCALAWMRPAFPTSTQRLNWCVASITTASHRVRVGHRCKLGAQGTVCAGGRYDGLVEQLGGRADAPAFGFAMGVERLVLLLAQHAPVATPLADVYLVAAGDTAADRALVLAESLRDAFPGVRIQANCGGGSFKSQMKKADRSGALLALVLGDDEVASGIVGIKMLREDVPQETVSINDINDALRARLPGRK
jgi:histidyl-tRNA synthetase